MPCLLHPSGISVEQYYCRSYPTQSDNHCCFATKHTQIKTTAARPNSTLTSQLPPILAPPLRTALECCNSIRLPRTWSPFRCRPLGLPGRLTALRLHWALELPNSSIQAGRRTTPPTLRKPLPSLPEPGDFCVAISRDETPRTRCQS